MPGLVIPAFGPSVPGRVLQRTGNIRLVDMFNVLTTGQRTPIEALTVIIGKRILIRQKPGFHTLHHQVSLTICYSGRLIPTVSGLEMRPWTTPRRNRSFGVHQEYDKDILILI